MVKPTLTPSHTAYQPLFLRSRVRHLPSQPDTGTICVQRVDSDQFSQRLGAR